MGSLRYLNIVLTVIALLLAAHLWTGWSATPVFESAAVAQSGGGIPDAGAQRKEMIDQLKKINQQVDQMSELLKSGRARVRIEGGTKTE